MAAAAVDGGNESVGRDGVGDPLSELDIDGAIPEERRREDDSRGAEADELARAFRSSDASTNAAGSLAQMVAMSRSLAPAFLAASRSMSCTFA